MCTTCNIARHCLYDIYILPPLLARVQLPTEQMLLLSTVCDCEIYELLKVGVHAVVFRSCCASAVPSLDVNVSPLLFSHVKLKKDKVNGFTV